MKYIYKSILLILVLSATCYAQDPQLTQFYAAPLYLAPSFAGSTEGSRVVLNYRNQWPLVKSAYQTYAMSYDHYFASKKSGVGVLFVKDVAGTGELSTTNFGLQYSFDLTVTPKWHLRPGIQIQVTQRTIDFEKLVFFEQLTFVGTIPNNSEANTMEHTAYLNFAASILGYSRTEWFGVNFDHINRPNQSLRNYESTVPMTYKVFGGKKISIKGKIGSYKEESLTMALNYKAQKEFDQLDLGVYWYKSSVVVGVWYRGIPLLKAYEPGYGNNDAIMLLAGYQLEDLKIGYSYDLTVSKLVSSTGGSHEISIIFEFLQDQKLKKRRRKVMVPCPKF